MNRAPEAPPAARSFAWSLGGHALFLALAFWLPRFHFDTPPPPFEIEITTPFLGDGPPKLGAPKAFVPGIPAKVNVTEKTPPTPTVKPPEPPKDWVLPGPNTKPLETAPPTTTPGGTVDGTGTAAKVGGSGEGSDEGVVGGHGHGGTPLSAFPKLLNRDEVIANLRKFYPESERIAGREADVMVVIHIGADGNVGSVDISRATGEAFDEAAKKVGKLMRFSPALALDGRPVAVRLPQAIQFRLTR
jgi:TonB family protein